MSFWFSVYREIDIPTEWNPVIFQEVCIAEWYAGWLGVTQIDNLVNEGQAKRTPSEAAINFRYAVPAKVIIPILEAGVDTGNFRRNPKKRSVSLNEERIKVCGDDDVIIIDVWDMS